MRRGDKLKVGCGQIEPRTPRPSGPTPRPRSVRSGVNRASGNEEARGHDTPGASSAYTRQTSARNPTVDDSSDCISPRCRSSTGTRTLPLAVRVTLASPWGSLPTRPRNTIRGTTARNPRLRLLPPAPRITANSSSPVSPRLETNLHLNSPGTLREGRSPTTRTPGTTRCSTRAFRRWWNTRRGEGSVGTAVEATVMLRTVLPTQARRTLNNRMVKTTVRRSPRNPARHPATPGTESCFFPQETGGISKTWCVK